MHFEAIDITGCRLVAASTPLGYIGPKHHAIVIGRCLGSGKIYGVESLCTGYQLSTYENFLERDIRNMAKFR